MHEITGAIISITLVMSSVFFPLAFIGGTAGVFYKQFGLTLAIAILLSAVKALTLSPALCAIFLKPHKDETGKKKGLMKRFFIAFNTAFTATTGKYVKAVSFLIGRKWIAIGGILAFAGIFYYLMQTTPTSFVPNEDMGSVMADIALPASASTERTQEVLDEVEILLKDIPEISNVLKVSGRGMISGSGSNYGMLIMRLHPWAERTGEGQDVQSIIGKMF